MARSRGPHLCARRAPFAHRRARGKSICPLVDKIRLGPQRRRAGRTPRRWRVSSRPARFANGRSARTPQRPRRARTGAFAIALRTANAPASWSTVALHRLGTRPLLPIQATMVRSLGPRLRANREPPANSRARGKSIRPLVGKIRLGPKLQRTGALHDAGAITDAAARGRYSPHWRLIRSGCRAWLMAVS